jgi:DNA-binding NarL/FixJ family response regulator
MPFVVACPLMKSEVDPVKPKATANKKLTVLLVDDHPLIRERVGELVRTEFGAEVVGESEECARTLELTRALHPDLILLDLVLKDGHGLDIIEELRRTSSRSVVLVLSMHDESLMAERCLLAGAHGYVSKQSLTEKLIDAIRTVLNGDVYLGADTSLRLAARIRGQRRRGPRLPLQTLTNRELQVFEFLGSGLNTREVAQTMKLHLRTVETYRARIKRRLGLKDGVELLRHAVLWAQTAGGKSRRT